MADVTDELLEQLDAVGLNDDSTLEALASLECRSLEDLNKFTLTELTDAGAKPFKARKLLDLGRRGLSVQRWRPTAEGGAASADAGATDRPQPTVPMNPRPAYIPGLSRNLSRTMFEASDSGNDAADRLLEKAMLLVKDKKVEEATPATEEALAAYEDQWRKLPAKTPPRQKAVIAFSFAAELFSRLDRLDDAERHVRTLVELEERSYGSGHAETADALHMLGWIQHRSGKMSEASASFGASLRVRLSTIGPSDSRTGSSYYYLGVIAEEQEKLEQALHNFAEALRIFLVTVGPEHRDSAAALSNIAAVLHKQKSVGKAVSAYERALGLKVVAYGPDHISTSETMYGLSQCLKDKGDYTTALTHAERAHEICLKELGADHARTVDASKHKASLAQLIAEGSAAKGSAAAEEPVAL